jgi:hypothetical protein
VNIAFAFARCGLFSSVFSGRQYQSPAGVTFLVPARALGIATGATGGMLHRRRRQMNKLRRIVAIALTGSVVAAGMAVVLRAVPTGATSTLRQLTISASGDTTTGHHGSAPDDLRSSAKARKGSPISQRPVRQHPATKRPITKYPMTTTTSPAGRSSGTSASLQQTSAAVGATGQPRVFAYYYLWWSLNHWISALGSSYPTTATPLPLPAQLDANGCHPTSRYSGNTLTDVPLKLYSQDTPGVIEADVRQAAAAGLTGFAVNWAGSGASAQSLTSTPYNGRLQLMVDAVHKVNAEGIPFKLWLSYKASASVLPLSHIQGDLDYFLARYGHDSAFDRAQSSKLTIIWQGSRKYPTSALQTVSARYRSGARILGDETNWSNARAPYLDGNAYYWSSQDPYGNPQSFDQLAALANEVHNSGTNPDGTRKVWIAPVTPGFDTQLEGGSTCVPRRNGQTLNALFKGNAATHPDGFALISWNEITEGTYIDPMTRYGSQDLNVLSGLIKNGAR